MTIKLIDALKFQDFYNAIKEKSLPFKTVYRLSTLFYELEKNIESYYDALNHLIEKYAKRNDKQEIIYSEDGSQIILKEDSIEAYKKEVQKLRNTEITVEDLSLSMTELESLNLTVKDLISIIPFL